MEYWNSGKREETRMIKEWNDGKDKITEAE
jgi:hypothetical protein